jgi:hypothetical protein
VTETAERAAAPPHLDSSWHRSLLDELCAIERETASPGEREAAQWVAEQLADVGADARLEEEVSNGGYWWPLGLAAGAGVVAGMAALRGRRALASALGAVACAAGIDDLPPRSRRLRSVLPKRRAWNVVATLGPTDAKRTVVLVAHHDTAHSGLVFPPALPLIAERLGLLERANASPPLMWPVVAGPGVVAAGALARQPALIGLGTALSAGSAAAMADIGSRASVPGANDNATGVVAMLAVAQALAERPTESVRVMLVSTSEEATCEGMHRFAARHFPHLPIDDTFFASIDTVGSPHLTVLRREGMFGLVPYPAEALALVDGLAEELGIWLFPNLSLRNATDGVYPLNAGYQCVSICSVNDLKNPANYHWPTDVPENVDFASVADAIRLTEAVVRRLDHDWLAP